MWYKFIHSIAFCAYKTRFSKISKKPKKKYNCLAFKSSKSLTFKPKILDDAYTEESEHKDLNQEDNNENTFRSKNSNVKINKKQHDKEIIRNQKRYLSVINKPADYVYLLKNAKLQSIKKQQKKKSNELKNLIHKQEKYSSFMNKTIKDFEKFGENMDKKLDFYNYKMLQEPDINDYYEIMLNGYKTSYERNFDIYDKEKKKLMIETHHRQYGRNGESIDTKLKLMKNAMEKPKKPETTQFPSRECNFKKYGDIEIIEVPKHFKDNYSDEKWINGVNSKNKVVSTSEIKLFDKLSNGKINKPPLNNIKDYNTFKKTFDFLQYENILMEEKLNKSKKEYQDASLFLDPRFIVPKDDKLLK